MYQFPTVTEKTDSTCSPKMAVPVANPFHVFPSNLFLKCTRGIERSCDSVVVQFRLLEIQMQHSVYDGRPGRLGMFQNFAHMFRQGGVRCVLNAPPTWVPPLLFLVQECF
jgi:hypothetical protein